MESLLYFIKMYKDRTLICMSLILCGLVTESFGLVIMPKDKRGWTLNSAGYLLGPHAANGHRSLNDKGGLAGKRDTFDDNYKSAVASSKSGLLDHSNVPLSAEQMQQA
ncbi:hypothetical protein chiPu_0018272 [Chiloscyllium punctatum]|uniref:Galanin domain-containing protein n=1 Tax=Chiloscyllium punctatum TaxID=137246 RepID=A0A401RM49_CHIPU|nr:hypothetical protein [Chiloscyllium punctatum]